MGEQIVLQDDFSEQPDKDMQEELKVVHDAEGERRSDSEYYDRFSQTSNGRRREMGSRRFPYAPDGDSITPFPPESPLHCNLISRLQSPTRPTGSLGSHRGGRYGATLMGLCISINSGQFFIQMLLCLIYWSNSFRGERGFLKKTGQFLLSYHVFRISYLPISFHCH